MKSVFLDECFRRGEASERDEDPRVRKGEWCGACHSEMDWCEIALVTTYMFTKLYLNCNKYGVG